MKILIWFVTLMVWLFEPYSNKRTLKSYKAFKAAMEEMDVEEGRRLIKEYS